MGSILSICTERWKFLSSETPRDISTNQSFRVSGATSSLEASRDDILNVALNNVDKVQKTKEMSPLFMDEDEEETIVQELHKQTGTRKIQLSELDKITKRSNSESK